MSDTVITVENLSKRYQLGQIGATSLRESAERWWHRVRGRDPSAHMGVVDGGNRGKQATGEMDGRTGEVWALRDVSFQVERGEVLGIIGKNGAGKSTLLKILTRITEPTVGRAVMRGRVSSLLEVGTGFHPELTGRENAYLNGAILGMRKAEIDERFDEIVSFAEIARFIDTPVKRYSSGMYVRLAFAVAAHLEPEILLVDEVLAVGDVAFQQKCLRKMGEVAGVGRTVLFVSHNMAAISRLCSRALFLADGSVAAEGKPANVVAEYLTVCGSMDPDPLAGRTDRRGDGRVRVTQLRFLDGVSGEDLKMAVCGGSLCICVEYEGNEDDIRELSRLNIGLALSHSSGQNITVLNSEQAGQLFEGIPASGSLRCEIPRLPLMPGAYAIKVTVSVNGILADQIDDAARLDVASGDFFGTGIARDHHRNGVYIDHRWRHGSAE